MLSSCAWCAARLLGVPYTDDGSDQRNPSAHNAEKRAELGGDLLARLALDQFGTDSHSLAALASTGTLMLAAGHDTTSTMIALGTLALLEHPDQLAAARHRRSRADRRRSRGTPALPHDRADGPSARRAGGHRALVITVVGLTAIASPRNMRPPGTSPRVVEVPGPKPVGAWALSGPSRGRGRTPRTSCRVPVGCR